MIERVRDADSIAPAGGTGPAVGVIGNVRRTSLLIDDADVRLRFASLPCVALGVDALSAVSLLAIELPVAHCLGS